MFMQMWTAAKTAPGVPAGVACLAKDFPLSANMAIWPICTEPHQPNLALGSFWGQSLPHNLSYLLNFKTPSYSSSRKKTRKKFCQNREESLRSLQNLNSNWQNYLNRTLLAYLESCIFEGQKLGGSRISPIFLIRCKH